MVEHTVTASLPIVTYTEAKTAGMVRYFTGKACSGGHISERLTSNGSCIACSYERSRANREKYAARAKAAAKKYNADNQEKRRAAWDRWYKANAEAVRAKAAVRWKAGAEARAAKAAEKKALRQPPKWKACATWRAKNPEKVQAMGRARRARVKGCEGRHTADEILALFKAQKGKCVACRVSIKAGYHADHIIPVIAGGANWISNIQLLCPTCNRSKGGKDPVVWAQARGMLL